MNSINGFDVPHLDETVYKYKTDEGLEIHIIEKKGFSKKYAFFGTRYGSIDNEFAAGGKNYEMPHGIAHFLEHKVFEEEDGDVFEIFSNTGARANAYTSHDSTNYLFSCTDRFYENLKILIGFVQSLNINSDSVEKEKGIIKQEIIMYEDNPEWQAYMNTLKLMYSRHPVHIDIAGTVESIKDIDCEMLDRCYRTFYSPENMIVFIIGDVDRYEAVETVESALTDDFKKRKSVIERKIPMDFEPVENECRRESFAVAGPVYYMGIKCQPESSGESAVLKNEIFIDVFLNIMLGKGSDLYKHLYESGLIGKNFGYDYNYGSGYGHIIIGGESRNPEEIYRILKEKFNENLEGETPESDFDRIKRKLMGESLIYLNSLEYIANSYVSMHHKGIDFFNYFKELEEFDYAEFVEFKKTLDLEGRTVLSVVYPKEEEAAK